MQHYTDVYSGCTFFLSALGRSPYPPVISFAHGASGFPPLLLDGTGARGTGPQDLAFPWAREIAFPEG